MVVVKKKKVKKRGWPAGVPRGSRPNLEVKFPTTITEYNDDLVGKTIWYFNPRKGITHITVTGIYSVIGRRHEIKWGLWYDMANENGKVISMMLWAKDYPLFPSRLLCERWVKAMLEKSKADRHAEMALGVAPKK